MKKTKYDKTIFCVTFGLLMVLNFFDTPYVFKGFLMRDIFDTISLILVFLVLIEINLIGVKKISTINRVSILLFTIIFILMILLHHSRLEYMIYLLYGIYVTITKIIEYKNKYYPKRKELPIDRVMFILFFTMYFIMMPVLSTDVFKSNELFLRGMLVGLLLGIIIAFYVYTKIGAKKNGAMLMFIVFISVVIVPIVTNGLNFALDTSDPITNTYMITDLDINGGSRSVTTHDVYFMVDGKEYHIDVAEDLYYSLEIGDEIELSIYQGFFGYEYILQE